MAQFFNLIPAWNTETSYGVVCGEARQTLLEAARPHLPFGVPESEIAFYDRELNEISSSTRVGELQEGMKISMVTRRVVEGGGQPSTSFPEPRYA